ncbi:DUF4394 domain-containing protein (plasmid) [Hymenobacter qilianensis]|uniref:DUF4394 domain-containing protein n=1 Tax=Hymenobacter qilianensis TaxID=1385715 RepID=A0A7H0H158_9BACT|nr:DUF4394 domain-containing protein [Hymenobacter qilianensis]QNP54274.1 DUF4394 domain-containing protein [Hymenobacter qilianensis]
MPVGNLNLAVSGNGGFDIDGRTGTALGLYLVNGNPTLFAVDLATGAARRLAQYAPTLAYTGLAIPTRPVGYAADFTGSRLHIFDPTDASVTVTKTITGFADFRRIIGLDFRPSNGQLYALTQSFDDTLDRYLYTINPATAEATLIGPITPRLSLTSESAQFDFDPLTDQIRVVSTNGAAGTARTLLLNPTTAVFSPDVPLTLPSPPGSFKLAHDNNVAGATTTNLYLIEDPLGFNNLPCKLYRQNTADASSFTEIGSLGPTIRDCQAFDIGGASNVGYLFAEVNSNAVLHTIDLATGKATPTGTITLEGFVRGFTLGLGF